MYIPPNNGQKKIQNLPKANRSRSSDETPNDPFRDARMNQLKAPLVRCTP